jgi:S-disulfanyl-L-cysteine oxidoreductase SoxD
MPLHRVSAEARKSSRATCSQVAGVLGVLTMVMLLGGSVLAQGPTGVGRAPTEEEIRAWDISISPTGEELPPGQGTSEEGRLVYRRQCASCHGADASGGSGPRLVKRDVQPDHPWDFGRILPIRAPYATVVWDYINRGMPLNREGTLTADQVYALTAYLLFINGVIPEETVLDAETLPAIEMPNRDAFARVPDWQPGKPRLAGYPH